MMFQHPVTKQLPQDITTELRQRRVDEQVLNGICCINQENMK